MAANVIRGVSDLDRFLASSPAFLPGPSLKLEVAGLGEAERVAWQTRLNRHHGICGCKSSAWFLTVSLVGYVVFLVVAPAGAAPVGWARLLWGALLVFTAGLAGKLIGLGVGALLFHRSVRLLRTRLTS